MNGFFVSAGDRLFLSRRTCLLGGVSLAAALGLSACATPPEPTAEQRQDALVQRFYQLLAAGDFDGCIALISARNLSKEQLTDFEPKIRRMLTGAQAKINAHGGLQSVEIVERVISEADQVTKLRVLVRYGDGNSRRERMNLFQEDGVWKVQL